MRNYLLILLNALLCIVISGCGFHLRSQQSLAAKIHYLYFYSAANDVEFNQLLRQHLTQAGIVLINNPKHTPYALHIIKCKFLQQGINTSQLTSLSLQKLTFWVSYSFTTNHQEAKVRTISITGSQLANANQMLGTENALLGARSQMRKEAIWQLLNQINNIKQMN